MLFICIFIPAIFSSIVDEKINHTKKSNRDFILTYFCYLFIITMLMNTSLFLMEGDVIFYTTKNFTYEFYTKYTWLSLVISIISPYILKCFKQAISINVEVKERKKNEVKEVKKNEGKKKNSKEKRKDNKHTKKNN